MNKFNGLMTSLSPHWATPKWLYDELDKEFHFDDDPCPLGGSGGLAREWGKRVYVNPPYGRMISRWIEKAWVSIYGQFNADDMPTSDVVVMLLPARTDTRWWHEYVMKAREIRFIRGRLKFGDSKNSAPFPSVIVIFNDSGRVPKQGEKG